MKTILDMFMSRVRRIDFFENNSFLADVAASHLSFKNRVMTEGDVEFSVMPCTTLFDITVRAREKGSIPFVTKPDRKIKWL